MLSEQFSFTPNNNLETGFPKIPISSDSQREKWNLMETRLFMKHRIR